MRLIHGDCMEVMAGMADGSVGATIADPPYSEKTHAGHDAVKLKGLSNDGADRKVLNYGHLTPEQVKESAIEMSRVTRGWTVTMCDHILGPVWSEAFAGLGRYVFPPLPFVSPGSRVRMQGDGPSGWTIWIIVTRPRNREFAKWGTLRGDYRFPPERRKDARMGGKPLSLMRSLVCDYSRPGDTVFDPYMGCGTTGSAAAIEGRKFLGIEVDEGAFDVAQNRMGLSGVPVDGQGEIFG